MTAISVPSVRHSTSRPAGDWFGGSMPVARLGVIVNLVVPGAVLLWDALHHQLGVNAVNFAIKTTGLIAITYLLLSLVVTPVQAITRMSWLVQFRRAIGCYAFYYAAAHLAIYFWWDRARSLSSTFEEITHHFYLTIGFVSVALMLPLMLTSFNAAIRTMGGRRWKLLHRLAYVSAGLGVWHYYLQAKADKSRPEIYIAVLGMLLLWRAVAGVARLRRRAPIPPAIAVPTAAPGKLRFWKGELKVIGMFRETQSVRTFRLAPPDGGAIPFHFKAGQFLNLTVPIDGRPTHRSYTIASSPTRDAYVELTIKREEQGVVSRYLHEMLMHGQSVSVSAPAGRFTFDPYKPDSPHENRVTLVAGGVGITPSMSIIRDLTDRGWAGRIDLLFIVRSEAEVIFADELRYLAARHPNLHVHVSITRDATPGWTGLRGRLTADMLRSIVPDLIAGPVYICGPTAMTDQARELLTAVGVPAARITVESFTPASAIARNGTESSSTEGTGAAVDNGVGVVTFAKSKRTADGSSHKTVLEIAEEAGVTLDFQCRAGVCGTCRCKLLSGEVTMDSRDALSEADEADGYILACQAVARGDVTVDA